MTPERWREVRRLFEEASALPPEERESFLAREHADPEVLHEVQRMLAAPSTGFLEPPELEEPTSGRDIGDFTLLEEIGKGGMGVVYRALQRSLRRIVAVKLLPASFALTQRQRDRFEREARSAARLSHANIVTVLTVGEERGVQYIAMEYVDGQDLARELERLREERGVSERGPRHLPSSVASEYFRTVAECIRQAADALAHAHEHRIVHRDVKPSNLLLDGTGRIKLVDFGLARDEDLGSLSASGDLLGTAYYMSPEQARAHRHQVDHRTDIYSLGVVLYELLTLKRPFEGKTSHEVLDKVLHREPASIRKLNPRVPRDLEAICITAMAKEAGERYSDAAALRDDLARFLEHQAIHARPPGPLRLALRWGHAHRRALAAVGLALVAALLAVLGASAHARRQRIEEHLAAIDRARSEGPLEALPLKRALDLRGRLAELRALGGVRAAEGDPVQALEREFDALLRELRERGQRALALSRDPAQPEGVREMSRLTGLQTLRQASDLFPEDEELRALARIEVAYPTLSVAARDADGTALAAEVYLRDIDPLTSAVGPARWLGAAPLPPNPVLPGYYRVVVVFAQGGFRELICNPGPAHVELELVAVRRADEGDLLQDMVSFEPATYTFPEVPGVPSFTGRAVALDGFWLDEHEVSNARYWAFVQATGRALPSYWALERDLSAFLERYGNMPVVGVTWTDAVALAEWEGKRLPTASEWMRAARGLENRALPYTAESREPWLGNVLVPPEPATTEEAQWAQYLRHVRAVDSHFEARTPEGLHHMLGNVDEWTESMVVVPLAGSQQQVLPFERYLFGGSWDLAGRRWPAWGAAMRGLGPHFDLWHTGFRCAKSVAAR